MNTRRTRSMGVLQSGQPLGMFATASAQFVQKRECPQGTRATSVRGAIRQTSHMSGVSVATAAVTVAVAADDGVEGSASSSSSSSEANWNASVCAPKLWLMARRNCSREYAPLSYRSIYVLMRASFCKLRFFFGRRISTPRRIRCESAMLSINGDVLQMCEEGVDVLMRHLYPTT